MEENERQEQILEALLQQMPEIGAPTGIMASVMGRIKPKRQSFWRQFISFAEEQRVACFKFAAVAATLVLVFWGGTRYQGAKLAEIHLGERRDNAVFASLGSNPEANLLVGRGFLASGTGAEALPYLQKAMALAPQSSNYAMWAGVGAAAVGNYTGERRFYERAIMLEPGNLKANLYMGHSFAATGSLDEAVYYYDKVLAIEPAQPSALYNRALLIGGLGGDPQTEIEAWGAYLARYRSGKWSYKALEHLNSLGDFTYRAHLVGSRRVILNRDELWGLNSQSQIDDVAGLQEIAKIVSRQPKGFELNVVAYAADAPLLAKEKALLIQKMIRQVLPDSRDGQVRASWFGVPETRDVGSAKYKLNESIILMGYINKQKGVAI